MTTMGHGYLMVQPLGQQGHCLSNNSTCRSSGQAAQTLVKCPGFCDKQLCIPPIKHDELHFVSLAILVVLS
jgi:hypothetical protein